MTHKLGNRWLSTTRHQTYIAQCLEYHSVFHLLINIYWHYTKHDDLNTYHKSTTEDTLSVGKASPRGDFSLAGEFKKEKFIVTFLTLFLVSVILFLSVKILHLLINFRLNFTSGMLAS